MKKPALCFFFIFCLAITGVCFGEARVEVDLIKREVKLVDFDFGRYVINGIFSFSSEEENGSLILNLQGSSITFVSLGGGSAKKVRSIPWIKMQLVKVGDMIFVRNLSTPQFKAKGSINLKENEFSLSIDGSWLGNYRNLQGRITAKVKFWGDLNGFLSSGYFIVTDGRYKGSEFSKFRVDFLGKPPLLNVTDSEVILHDGTVLEVRGELNLGDFSNLMPGAKFTPQKVFIGEWQLFSEENKEIGLKKDIDERLGVTLGRASGEGAKAGTETELRYNLEKDKYLKLKMDGTKTILGVEKRREF